jgi:hypothetical protein
MIADDRSHGDHAETKYADGDIGPADYDGHAYDYDGGHAGDAHNYDHHGCHATFMAMTIEQCS